MPGLNHKKIYEVPEYGVTTTPGVNPNAGFWKFYPKTDGFYQLNSSGVESKILRLMKNL